MVQACVRRLQEELERRGIRFRPHVWLSDEFFSPDGIPGIAVPFYLAHPRLLKLEKSMMLQVEGGTPKECMRLLRHEAGHALDTAYRIRRRRKWRETFGRASKPYPRYYTPRPYSKNYVLHLDWWYAQSHPVEDFAETFAVWLAGENWKKRYRGWPALRKLHVVDEIMKEIGPRRPLVAVRAREGPVTQIRKTLRRFYREKRKRYRADFPDFYDRDLRRLFAERRQAPNGESAASFLRRIRPEIRTYVSDWTGQHAYTIDLLLKEMIARCRDLKLRTARPERELKLETMLLVTVQTMHLLYSGRHRIAL